MFISKQLCIFFLVFIFTACSQPDKENTEKGSPIAKVGESMLYKQDLSGIVPPKTPKNDSIQMVEMYIDSWVKTQLMFVEAKSLIEFDEAEIDRKVLEYKYNLLAYELEKKYVNENLNTEISEKEIDDYYQNNQANFELKNNIIKGIFITVPKNAPRQDTLKQLMLANKKADYKEIKEYCLKFAVSSSLNDSVWVEFEKNVVGTPFAEIPNKIDFLQQNQFVIKSDNEFNYYLKINDYKISNQISPLPFVRERIIGMIINQRKMQLIKKLEQEIYEKAKKNNTFTIFKNE